MRAIVWWCCVVAVVLADQPVGPPEGIGGITTTTEESGRVTTTDEPTAKLKRNSGHLTDDDDNEHNGSQAKPQGPPTIESRQGRIAQSVQTHRSNVATYTSGSGVRTPQGPIRNLGPRPPAPPPSDEGPLPPAPPIDVTEIRCLKMATREKFSAIISIPEGLVNAPPIFEHRPSIDPITSRICQIQPASRTGTFKLEVINLEACGVESCEQPDGTYALCLTLRFPVLAGLKLPEDETIQIRCKPQDRTVAERKDIDFDGESFTPRVEQKLPTTFTGGKQEFLCEIGLFRRLPGTSLYSQRIGPGSAVELGEEVQLRSIVRSNDGWYYSKLTDVVVRRLKKQPASNNIDGSATLVLSDGCRNPNFKAIAAQHPQRDARSSLLNNFNFRVFLFQDMDDGDSIVVSARVFACVEAIDCAPTLCPDDRGQGSGRRRKRSSWNVTEATGTSDGSGRTREILIEQLIYPNGTVSTASSRHLKGWESDLALRVAMPGDYYTGTRAVPLSSLDSHCFLYLMLTVGLGTALGVTTLLVSIYCMCTCRRRGNKSVVADVAPAGSARAVHSTPAAPTSGSTSTLETLMMEACYPELQVLDALSRSVRQKKQNVHQEMIKLYGAAATANAADSAPNPIANVYSSEPRPSLKQLKRQRQQAQERSAGQNVTTVVVGPPTEPKRNQDALYWEIGQHSHQILPPTSV